jgi:Tol biopolymer transport system component
MAALIACACLPAASQAAFPGTNAKIAYEGPGLSGVSDSSIFSMNPDGSGKTNLTPNPVSAPARRGGGVGSFHPEYSADGRKIVFDRVAQGAPNEDIWIMNADGSGSTDITNTPSAVEFEPSFSPDGSKIVFQRYDDQNSEALWTMNVDGTGAARLGGLTSLKFPGSPEYSPDGAKIAFDEAGDTRNDIYTIGANGQGLANITSAVNGSNIDPSWSPDGSRIAFESYNSTADRSDILAIGADGGAATNLTAAVTNAFVASPSFSPDGKLIAYERSDAPYTGDDIYTMRATDGLAQTNITSDSPAQDRHPNWGPTPTGSDDATPPETKITKEPKDSDKTKAKLRFKSNEAQSTFECALKGKNVRSSLKRFAPCDGGKAKYKNLELGKKKFLVRATDPAGNTDPTPAKAKWKVL